MLHMILAKITEYTWIIIWYSTLEYQSYHQWCPFRKKRGAGDWYTIYHHSPILYSSSYKALYENQPMGIWDIYDHLCISWFVLPHPFDDFHLVGGISTPLKNMSSSIGMIIPNWMEKQSSHVPVTTNITIFITINPHHNTSSSHYKSR